MNKEDPLVSIALATYNGEKFLKEQLNSLIEQTYKNIEIVISDDGSSDSTITILDEFKKKDSRILYSKNPKPAGFKKNFERAISLCNGNFIFLCDQDDIWDKEKINIHIKVYDSDPEIAWMYNEVELIDEHKNYIGLLTDKCPIYYEKINLLNYIGGRCILGCATSYRSSLIKDIWPISDLAPSHDSWIQLFLYNKKHWHIALKLQKYRQHQTNVFGIINSNKNSPDDILKNIQKSISYTKDLCKNKKLEAYLKILIIILLIMKSIKFKIKSFTKK